MNDLKYLILTAGFLILLSACGENTRVSDRENVDLEEEFTEEGKSSEEYIEDAKAETFQHMLIQETEQIETMLFRIDKELELLGTEHTEDELLKKYDDYKKRYEALKAEIGELQPEEDLIENTKTLEDSIVSMRMELWSLKDELDVHFR